MLDPRSGGSGWGLEHTGGWEFCCRSSWERTGRPGCAGRKNLKIILANETQSQHILVLRLGLNSAAESIDYERKDDETENGLLSLLGVAALLVWPAAARADDTATIKELQNQVKALQEQVQKLQEAQSAAAARGTGQDEAEKDKGLDGLLGRDFLKSKGLTFGFYGETKCRFPESGANSFDAHRFVLLPGYQFADWLVFNAELELEHGAVDESVNGGRNRFNGELELEQFYVDILLNEHFNIRSLGIDVMPVGRISKYHEPTVFYSTERPELYREIIPTTWQEPSLGIFGKIVDNLDYQLTVSTGLEDFIPRRDWAPPASRRRTACGMPGRVCAPAARTASATPDAFTTAASRGWTRAPHFI